MKVDYISRESVLGLLNDYRDKHFENRKEYPVNYGTLLDILRWIRNLPSVTLQEPRWIPVSERLPKAGEYVGNVAKYYLVQNEYGDMLVARYTHSEYWEQMYQINPISDEIVAWMPLPKAYKEVEE